MEPQFCSECGAALDENGNCPNPNCTNHSASSKSKQKPHVDQEPQKPSGKLLKKFPEEGKAIVPDCVKSDQNEEPVRQYDIARLQTLIKGAFAEGRLQVTNKRVLFRSVGNSIVGPTSLQYEFSIEEIAGIEIRKEASFNFFSSVILAILTLLIVNFFGFIFAPFYSWGFISTIFSLALAGVSCLVFLILKDSKFIRHIALSFALTGIIAGSSMLSLFSSNALERLALAVVVISYMISFLFLAFAPNLVIIIKTKGGSPSIEIRKKDGFFSFQHNEYTGFAQVMPGPDTDVAINEIGALIREIQQNGN